MDGSTCCTRCSGATTLAVKARWYSSIGVSAKGAMPPP